MIQKTERTSIEFDRSEVIILLRDAALARVQADSQSIDEPFDSLTIKTFIRGTVEEIDSIVVTLVRVVK